jgi:hypothetical protein
VGDAVFDRLLAVASATGRPPAEVERHHALEGLLRRLARLPEPEAFVLRGGMLTRLWAAPVVRPAADLDLVGTFPHDVVETRRRFEPAVRDGGVDDGLTFDPAALRARGIWPGSDFPGVRVSVRALTARGAIDLTVDVGFGDPLVPAARRIDYPTLVPGEPARVWAARPETMVGWKLHGLAERRDGWRPKDLYDLWLITGRMPLDPALLPEAIAVAFTSRGYATAGAPAVFGPGAWWATKAARRRWEGFADADPTLGMPGELGPVVAEVADRLRPALEGMGPS